MKPKVLYLAYGSNMNRTQMKRRCTNAEEIESGYLQGYKLVFGGYSKARSGLVADIKEDPNSKIPYVLWRIDDTDHKSLDDAEGYPKHYDARTMTMDSFDHVLFYYMTENKKKQRKPEHCVSKEYEKTIREAYIEHDLDLSYLDRALSDAHVN